MIYRLLGYVIKFTIFQFFRTIHVTGAPQVSSGPVLFAANHPNQAVDPFIIGTLVDRPVSFLAKSTLFSNRFLGLFFRRLNMIPVYRKRDNSDTAKNEEMFRAVAHALTHGRAVVIFPEGTSTEARQVQPVKSGAARMAFVAESEANFMLGCKIQPLSITYSDPYTFQSSVTVMFGDPILVGGYKNLWMADPQRAVKELTGDLDRAIRTLSIDLKDLSNQPLIEKIARIFSSTQTNDRERFREIAAYVEALAPKYPEKRIEIEKRLDYYLDMATVFNLEHYHPYFASTHSVGQRALYLLLAPLILLGIISHAAPYYSIQTLIQLFRIPRYNYASAKIMLSVLLFPIWYTSLFLIIRDFTMSFFISVCCVVGVMIAGYVTSRFFDKFWLATIEFLWPAEKNPVHLLTRMRDELRQELRAVTSQ